MVKFFARSGQRKAKIVRESCMMNQKTSRPSILFYFHWSFVRGLNKEQTWDNPKQRTTQYHQRNEIVTSKRIDPAPWQRNFFYSCARVRWQRNGETHTQRKKWYTAESSRLSGNKKNKNAVEQSLNQWEVSFSPRQKARSNNKNGNKAPKKRDVVPIVNATNHWLNYNWKNYVVFSI